MKPKDRCVSAAAVKNIEEKGGYEGIKKTLKTKQSRTKDQGRDSKKKKLYKRTLCQVKVGSL